MMIFINKRPNLLISSYTAETNLNKNQQGNLETISFKTVNQLMMVIEIKNRHPHYNLTQTCGISKSIC